MIYQWKYQTPEGFSDILLSSDGTHLTGLWFEGSRDARKHGELAVETLLPIFAETVEWLDIYFSGKAPDFTPSYRIGDMTDFRGEVVELMLAIPFGETVTYGRIAAKIAQRHGLERMSAQAVGGAVGWNPICLIIPCHRVVGANGALTGYGGGMENKVALLKLEGHRMEKFRVPRPSR